MRSHGNAAHSRIHSVVDLMNVSAVYDAASWLDFDVYRGPQKKKWSCLGQSSQNPHLSLSIRNVPRQSCHRAKTRGACHVSLCH